MSIKINLNFAKGSIKDLRIVYESMNIPIQGQNQGGKVINTQRNDKLIKNE